MSTVAAPAPRYGITTHASDEARDWGDADRLVWQLSHHWEVLELADGSLFLDSGVATHKVVSNPPAWLRTALRLIDETPCTLADLATSCGLADAATARRRLSAFIDAGIIVPHRRASAPDWAGPELVERFSTQLEWLATFDPSPGAHWRLFERLRRAHVTILGMGGAGSLLAQSLAAAGVGYLRLVDGDEVEASNLVRQVLYRSSDLGRSKATSMAAHLADFTPFTEVEADHRYVHSMADVRSVVGGSDFVAVCADGPRFVLNRWVDEACKAESVPYIGAFAGCVGPLYRPGRPGCFRCLEQTFRAELGDRHDMVVDALAAKSSWRYPAFVAGPMGVTAIMTTEVVLSLTEAATPRTQGAMVRMQHPQSLLEPIRVDAACDCSPAGGSIEDAPSDGTTDGAAR